MDKHRLYLTYYAINTYTGDKRRLYTTADVICDMIHPRDNYDYLIESEGLIEIGNISYEGEDPIDASKWSVGNVTVSVANDYIPVPTMSSYWGDIMSSAEGYVDRGWGLLSPITQVCCTDDCLLLDGEIGVIEVIISLAAIQLDGSDSTDMAQKTYDGRLMTYVEHASGSLETEAEILIPLTYEATRAYPHETYVFRGIVDIDSVSCDQQNNVTSFTLIGYEKMMDNLKMTDTIIPFSSLDEILSIIFENLSSVVTGYEVSDYINLIMNWLRRVGYKTYDMPEDTYIISPFVNVTRSGSQHYIHNVNDVWEPVPGSVYTYAYGCTQISYPIPGEDPALRGYVAEDQGIIYTGDVVIHSVSDSQLVDLFNVTVVGEPDGPPTIPGHARHHSELVGASVTYDQIMDFFPTIWSGLSTIPSAWSATPWTSQPYIPSGTWGTGPYEIDGNARWQRRPVYGAGFGWGAFHFAGLHITRGDTSEVNPIGSTNYDGHDISVTDGILLTISEIPYEDTGGGVTSRATTYCNVYYFDGSGSVDDDGQYYRLAQYAWSEFSGEAADGYIVYWFYPWDRFIIVSPDRTRAWVYPDPYERVIDGNTRGNEFNMPPGLLSIPYASQIFVRPVNTYIGATYCNACIYYKSTINNKWYRQYISWTLDGMTVVTTPTVLLPTTSSDILSGGDRRWTGDIPPRPIYVDESSSPGAEAVRIWFYDSSSKSLVCLDLDLNILYIYNIGYDQSYVAIGGMGEGVMSQPTSVSVHISPWSDESSTCKANTYIVLTHSSGHPEDCILLPLDTVSVGSILDSISKNYNYYYTLTPTGVLRLSPRYLGELRSKNPKVVAASGLTSSGTPAKNEIKWSVYPHRFDYVSIASDWGVMGYAGSDSPVSKFMLNFGKSFFNRQYGSVWSQYLYMLYRSYRRELSCSFILFYDYIYNRLTPFIGDWDPSTYPPGTTVPGQFWMLSEALDLQRDITNVKLLEKITCDPDIDQIGLTTCVATGFSWTGQQWTYVVPTPTLSYYTCYCPDCHVSFLLLLQSIEDLLNYGYVGYDGDWSPSYLDEAQLLEFIFRYYDRYALDHTGTAYADPISYYFSEYTRCYALNDCDVTT